MSKFDISGSKIEQLTDTGNNYKFAGKAESIALSEQGHVVQTTGTDNRVQVDKPAKGLWTMIWGKIKTGWKWLTASVGA